MTFELLRYRLIAQIRWRVQNGELTERRLARMIGVSQSHMHNVLKGIRVLSPAMGDRILQHLRLSLLELCSEEEKRTTSNSLYPLEVTGRPRYEHIRPIIPF